MPALARYEPQRRTLRRGCAEAFAVQCADACTCKICTTARHTVPWCAEHFECVGVRLSAKGHLQQPNTGRLPFQVRGGTAFGQSTLSGRHIGRASRTVTGTRWKCVESVHALGRLSGQIRWGASSGRCRGTQKGGRSWFACGDHHARRAIGGLLELLSWPSPHPGVQIETGLSSMAD